MQPLSFDMHVWKSFKMNFGFEYTGIKFHSSNKWIFMDKFMEIKMGFNRSLHTKFFFFQKHSYSLKFWIVQCISAFSNWNLTTEKPFKFFITILWHSRLLELNSRILLGSNMVFQLEDINQFFRRFSFHFVFDT